MTKISVSLSSDGITDVIEYIKHYQQDFLSKIEMFKRKVAERISYLAGAGFANAIVDDISEKSGGPRMADVDTYFEERGDSLIVVAMGQDAVWVEFGAGVFHNGSVGSSPHPKGAELGFTIGEYGKGFGKLTTWGFYENGEFKLTKGTPATMPMYNAVKEVCDDIENIAKEVFK